MASTSAAIIGSTGLVGSFILTNLLANDAYKPVHTITRRAPKPTSDRLQSLVEADTTKWAASLSGLSPAPSAVFSSLGTTRAAAGGIANQWKIDHDLNIELAKAAKEAGVRTYVFVSSGGTRGLPFSAAPYSKMKNGVEDAIRDLDFEHAIILKPGMILGEREESRAAEGLMQGLVRSIGKLSGAVADKVGQDAEVIARSGIRATQLAGEGKAPAKYWVVEAGDIVRLGRNEWPADKPEAKPE